MNLLPSDEQTGIVEASRAFLSGQLPIARTREMFGESSNIDAGAWSEAAELGWFGLGLPERFGGVGCGLADEALLFREIGRSLASGPFLSTVVAARVAAFAGHADLAEAIVSGQPVGFVVAESHGTVSPDGVLNGPLQLVDASGDLAVVVTPTIAALIDVTQLHDVEVVESVDPAVRLHRALAHNVIPGAVVAVSIDPVAQRAMVLAAAMLNGITEASRDIGAEHAKVRVQFGKPIGVNQAIKHPCADMAVKAQLAYAQTIFAAASLDEQRSDSEFHATGALLVSASAAEFSTAAALQILGGMGFTFEHDIHLYVKRTHLLTRLFHGTSHQLGRLIDLPLAE